MMLSSAVSICGVSAAIASSGAIKGDPKKLSYVISMVLITAIPMMICMPYVAHYFYFPQDVAQDKKADLGAFSGIQPLPFSGRKIFFL